MKKIFVLLALLLVLLTGCGKEEVLTERSQSFDGGEVQSINIDLRDRGIQVSPSADGQIHLDYADSETEAYAIDVRDGVLTVALETSKEWTDYVGKKSGGTLTVQLPEAVFEAVSLSTTNGDITLSELTVEDLSLNVNNGDIAFETLDAAESVTLTAKNGDIDGKIAGGYDDFAMTCTIKKGDTNLPEEKAGGDKTLTVDMNNGDVNIEFVK